MLSAILLFSTSLSFSSIGSVHGQEATLSAIRGETLPASALGPSVIETMKEVLARERANLTAGSPLSMPAPQRARSLAPSTAPSGGSSALSTGTSPLLGTNFLGPSMTDPGAGWIPPDPHGAIGPNHFLAIVNQRFTVYDRSGVNLFGSTLQSFFGATGSQGDARAAYDHFSGRFVISCCDFSMRIRLAVSATNDPTGAWFKTSFIATSGVDTGHHPDYPTLGFDANGLYVSPFMVGGPNTMTIFAIEKAPLVAPVQSLGTVTAFRALPYEDSIQPCITFGTPAGEYLISRASTTSLRLRRVDPPLTAPTLVEIGMVSVPAHSDPPNAPVMGATTPFWTVDARPLGAVFQAGSVWTLHAIDVSGRAGVRWYQIDPLTVSTQQVGTIGDPVRHYFFPSMAVNASGDLAIGCAGSHAGEFAGGWYAGRKASDMLGMTSTPALLKAGIAAYERLDGSGNNRWGDYTNATLDPSDPSSFWTIQELALTTNSWSTWIGKVTFASGPPPIAFCAGDGIDAMVTQTCPCLNFGAAGRGCANSINSAGAVLSATGSTNPDALVLQAAGMPSIASAGSIFLQGDAPAPGGVVFGDGLRCADGSLIRLGSKPMPSGSSQYPEAGDSSVSVRGGVTPGSGVTRYYQTYYRNSAAGFCPPATFNATNGLIVVW